MAHVVLLSATPADDQTPDHLAPLHDMQKRAACDRRGVHRLTSSPEEADVILFVESYGAGWHFERVRRHPFTRRYRKKCFLFCSNPYVIPFLPGIYTARDQRWSSRRTISTVGGMVSAHQSGETSAGAAAALACVSAVSASVSFSARGGEDVSRRANEGAPERSLGNCEFRRRNQKVSHARHPAD